MDSRAVKLIRTRPAYLMREMGFDLLNDELHGEWMKWMLFDKDDGTLQAHRGSYKTTCAGGALALHPLLFPQQRVLFVRKTDTDTDEVIAQAQNVIAHPLFQSLSKSLYGEPITLTVENKSAIDTSFKIGISGAPQVLGMGSGGSLTGKHFDKIFTDDIVNVKDRVSAAERRRVKLMFQELQNVKNRGGCIKNMGTPWHKDDCFSIMPEPMRFDCYSTGLISKDEVKHLRKVMTPSLFAANYELKHIADENALFGEPEYFSDPSLIYDGIAHVDAAYGGEDHTALTIVKKRGDVYYVFGMLWPKHVDSCIEQIGFWVERLRAGTLWCEKNADKGYLAQKLNALGIKTQTYSEHMNKHLKISTHLKGAWHKVRFLDCDSIETSPDYIAEILDYTEEAAHDDAPDSLASAIRTYENRPGFKGFKEGI